MVSKVKFGKLVTAWGETETDEIGVDKDGLVMQLAEPEEVKACWARVQGELLASFNAVWEVEESAGMATAAGSEMVEEGVERHGMELDTAWPGLETATEFVVVVVVDWLVTAWELVGVDRLELCLVIGLEVGWS